MLAGSTVLVRGTQNFGKPILYVVFTWVLTLFGWEFHFGLFFSRSKKFGPIFNKLRFSFCHERDMTLYSNPNNFERETYHLACSTFSRKSMLRDQNRVSGPQNFNSIEVISIEITFPCDLTWFRQIKRPRYGNYPCRLVFQKSVSN